MMAIEQNYPLIPIKEFTSVKQAGLFEILKQPRFSGQLILSDPSKQEWIFHIYMGRLMYATGGTHPVRRWRRNLLIHCPQTSAQLSSLQDDLANTNWEDVNVCWDYHLLCLWVDLHKVTRDQAVKMIQSVMVEILFDVTQGMQITYQIKPDSSSSLSSLFKPLVLIDAEQVIHDADQVWEAWQSARVADRCPNRAPIIRQPEQLRVKTSPQAYQTMTKLLNGQYTLRDLAILMKRDTRAVTLSILPHLQSGLVELIEIPDLPAPVSLPPNETSVKTVPEQKPLIACVDDSPLICQSMEKILTSEGYRFVAINDALRAIATLLATKPDLIFLDLVMPNANGYEICGQLRKLSFFRNTPIVILTGNDGIIDRVRAKMVGSSDFMSKPINPEEVLRVIIKHLKQII
ncbi:response regulator [Moorena producens PAL-8-15-08-1]|uniref:Response regulator n=1 Tax=Moorena producens PAL-8-15-08-1 TaxID=1458985 RepID=A0A1D8TT79_9CYAN|nr:response regulator [Moorena producens]AOX00840.1 response regulator [Moorena producens PAL-8-15-08-1]